MPEKKKTAPISCPQCGARNKAMAIRCEHCGADLTRKLSIRSVDRGSKRKNGPKASQGESVSGRGIDESSEPINKVPVEESVSEIKGQTITELYQTAVGVPGSLPTFKNCPRCGHTNEAARSECEVCHAPLATAFLPITSAMAKEHPFSASLGVGCLAFGIGYVLEQVIVLLLGLMLANALGDAFTLCSLFLLVLVEGVMITVGSNIVKDRGYRGLHPGGVALAAVLSIICILIIGSLLAANLSLF